MKLSFSFPLFSTLLPLSSPCSFISPACTYVCRSHFRIDSMNSGCSRNQRSWFRTGIVPGYRTSRGHGRLHLSRNLQIAVSVSVYFSFYPFSLSIFYLLLLFLAIFYIFSVMSLNIQMRLAEPKQFQNIDGDNVPGRELLLLPLPFFLFFFLFIFFIFILFFFSLFFVTYRLSIEFRTSQKHKSCNRLQQTLRSTHTFLGRCTSHGHGMWSMGHSLQQI